MTNISDNELNERLALKLKLERVRHGYTLQQVSNFTGMDSSDLSKYERAELQINFRNLNVLLHFYEISVQQFFFNFNDFDLEKLRNLVSKSKKK